MVIRYPTGINLIRRAALDRNNCSIQGFNFSVFCCDSSFNMSAARGGGITTPTWGGGDYKLEWLHSLPYAAG